MSVLTGKEIYQIQESARDQYFRVDHNKFARAIEAAVLAAHPPEMEPDYKAALLELVGAIAERWDGESDRKRANALAPRIEAAVDAAKALLGESVTVSENERMRREIAALRSKIEGDEQ